ncbi:MAG: RluA family pseudouridine synthase [Firmicutes bacterium]|nr:RluA family pseudouridine synthase [Bacillota bacterium]
MKTAAMTAMTAVRSESMAENKAYIVTDENVGVRLDVFAAAAAGISRTAAARMADAGEILVNGAPAVKKTPLRAGDTVTLTLSPAAPCELAPENIPLDIIYEDDDIIVINKPSGMVVHPGAGNENGTLVNALLYHCGGSLSGVGGVTRPGIVHRIDRQTSGLICAAKNNSAHISLSGQLAAHSMRRIYEALLVGYPAEDVGTIDVPIGRDVRDRIKMSASPRAAAAREAVTDYRVKSRLVSPENEKFALVECRLHTGRTHQIRVHMAYIHHPVAGDETYGAGRTKFERAHRELFDGQCLHAMRLILTHPRTGEEMEFSAPRPEGMEKIIGMMREDMS